MSDTVNRVVLAYSGGLDTSVILRWLTETYDCEVVTFTADLGQGEELDPVRGKAEAAGVKPENQAGTLRRAPVNMRINAKGAVIPAQQGRRRFDEFEIGPPHQGAVGEHPYIVCTGAGHKDRYCQRPCRAGQG